MSSSIDSSVIPTQTSPNEVRRQSQGGGLIHKMRKGISDSFNSLQDWGSDKLSQAKNTFSNATNGTVKVFEDIPVLEHMFHFNFGGLGR